MNYFVLLSLVASVVALSCPVLQTVTLQPGETKVDTCTYLVAGKYCAGPLVSTEEIQIYAQSSVTRFTTRITNVNGVCITGAWCSSNPCDGQFGCSGVSFYQCFDIGAGEVAYFVTNCTWDQPCVLSMNFTMSDYCGDGVCLGFPYEDCASCAADCCPSASATPTRAPGASASGTALPLGSAAPTSSPAAASASSSPAANKIKKNDAASDVQAGKGALLMLAVLTLQAYILGRPE